MKAFHTLWLLILPVVAGAQANTEYGNFKLEEQQIIYQKIFLQEGISAGKLAEYYKTVSIFSNVEVVDGDVMFDINDLIVDYKKFMFSQVGTPSIVQTGRYSGGVTVGVKDGRFRVTVRSIQLTGDIGYKKITEKENLTSFASKNSGTILAQDWCRPNMLGLIDQAFTDKLQYVEPEKKKKDDGDW